MNKLSAFILLDKLPVIDLPAVANALARRYPDLKTSFPHGENKQGEKDMPLLLCNGKVVAILSVGAALPRDEFLIQRTSMTWPTARASFDRHAAHLIVSPLSTVGEGKPLDDAHILTAVVGGLITAVPACLGVVWGSQVAHPAARWLDLSKAAFAPYPHFPSSLWISQHPFRDETTGAVGVVTQGLNRFVGRELELTTETTTDLQPLLARADGLASYLIEKGPVLKDGSTFGISDTERVAVRLCTSERFPGLAVIAGSLSSIERQTAT